MNPCVAGPSFSLLLQKVQCRVRAKKAALEMPGKDGADAGEAFLVKKMPIQVQTKLVGEGNSCADGGFVSRGAHVEDVDVPHEGVGAVHTDAIVNGIADGDARFKADEVLHATVIERPRVIDRQLIVADANTRNDVEVIFQQTHDVTSE